MALTLILSVNSLSLVEGAFRLSSAHNFPVYYNVDYDVHDYRTGETFTLRYSIRSDAYTKYRDDYLPKLQIAAGNDQAYGKLVTPDEPVVRKMAQHLYELSDGDEELYTNYALQVAHQMYYSLTPQAKSAVETLVEASGDCDPQATVVASLIESANRQYADFDADVVLLLYWPYTASANEEVQWGHMQVGVRLDGGLDDARSKHMEEPAYYNYEGDRYYVGEPTFERGFNPDWKQGWRLGENWYPRQPDVVIEV